MTMKLIALAALLIAVSSTVAMAQECGCGESYVIVGGIDGNFRLGNTHLAQFVVMQSQRQTLDGRELSGAVMDMAFKRNSRNINDGCSTWGDPSPRPPVAAVISSRSSVLTSDCFCPPPSLSDCRRAFREELLHRQSLKQDPRTKKPRRKSGWI